MPQYKKAFDIGTYTGNGGQLRIGMATLRGVGPGGKQVAGATRFRSTAGAYMNRTPGVAGNQQKWTLSLWTKIGAISGSVGSAICNFGATSTSSGYLEFGFSTGSNLYLYMQGVGNTLISTLKFVDTSRWYHIVLAYDTTQATASSRVRLYLDGVEITSFSTDSRSSISQNYNTAGNGTNRHILGTYANSAGSLSGYQEGYMSEVYLIDGQQLTPSSFGEYNSDGIWVPKGYSGTYGTNGFYLPMNSSANYATDQSGNGNNWTPSGFNVTTANTTYDLMTDSPTDYLSGSMSTANNAGNYATLNPNDNGGATISSGGLQTVSGSATWYSTRSTIGNITSGKWYWEGSLTVGSQFHVGICSIYTTLPSYFGSQAAGYAYNAADGLKYNNNSATAYGATFTTGDVIGVAFDADNGALYFSKNGIWQNSGDPTSGSSKTGAAFTGLTSGSYSPAFGIYSSTAVANFGQRAFSYTPPAGYKSLNTYNITRPADSSLWFYGDTPDLMWIKNRSTTGLHTITDTVRGMGLNLVTSSTAAETSYPGVTEMNKFGMSIINDATSILNGSTNSHVYWTWKAGSNTSSTSVTNTNGSITSQVSANPSAGFSIASWTGTAAAATIGHGLSAAPNFIIVRRRDSADWVVYHSSIGNTVALFLNSSGAAASSSFYWNNTSPTSSVFTVGAPGGGTNTSGGSFIAYCWTAIPGYSSFGSWVGSGGADGPYIYLGFKPKFVMYKRSDTLGNDWTIHDSTRDYYNGYSVELYPSVTNAEGGPYSPPVFDFVSNGLKIRSGTASYTNTSGGNYIYAAFADIPFKYARSR